MGPENSEPVGAAIFGESHSPIVAQRQPQLSQAGDDFEAFRSRGLEHSGHTGDGGRLIGQLAVEQMLEGVLDHDPFVRALETVDPRDDAMPRPGNQGHDDHDESKQLKWIQHASIAGGYPGGYLGTTL